MSTNNFPPHIRCSVCRQTGSIVKATKGMYYCEKHQDKAPTAQQLHDYIHEHSMVLTTGRFDRKRKSSTGSSMAAPIADLVRR